MEYGAFNLKKDGVEVVDYSPELRQSVENVAQLWQQFCQLPMEVKQAFSSNNHQWTVGYEAKDGSGNHGDVKENFDFAASGMEEFERTIAGLGNTAAKQFIEAALRLDKQITPLVLQFGRRMENEYGIEGFEALARKSAKNAFFRFLHYPGGRGAGDVIAEPHVDHSGFTFHLFETTDGCERLTFDNKWESLPVAEGEAVTFASMQTQLVSNGEIKGLTHRVIANETSARVGRYAIVCFIALEGVPGYDKTTHGRLQEKEPGFNYAIDTNEFEKLFKN